MSVAKDEDELEQHLPDGSNDEQMDTIVEEDESPSMVQNHIESGPGEEYASEDKNFSVPSEDRLDDGSDFVETPELNTCTQTSNRLSRSKNHDDKGLAMRDDRILNQVNHLHENSSSLNVKPEPVNGLGDLYHDSGEDLIDTQTGGNEAEMVQSKDNGFSEMAGKQDMGEEYPIHREGSNQSYHLDRHLLEGDESGTEEEQAAFTRELESFFKERSMEFKPPKFYGEGLNCLKLWRAVTRLGGYDQVTSCKLWRQVGESFKPPKTCTTVSWSFRCFYEKALLDYERHKLHGGELPVPVASLPGPSMSMAVENPLGGNQAPGSGRARRDAAARAMQGWHSQRLLGNGEVGDPIIKDKNSVSLTKREKQLKSLSMLKRKKPSRLERAVKAARTKGAKPQMDTTVVDIGPCADWVKINVRRTKDCFEVYALVPGLLREEVRVQSDPAGRLVISGEPEQPDNPWGVTPFKKIISLPSRIDPHQTSAVVTLHGQLFVRAPFEQSDL